MELVAKHANNDDIICPLCRGVFSSKPELRRAIASAQSLPRVIRPLKKILENQ
ncbi:unnamed protein product, partial [Nesidiocoris tenuis]